MRTWMRRLRAAFVIAGGEDAPVPEAPPVPVSAVARRFWPYARPYRKWLVLTGGFIVLEAAIRRGARGGVHRPRRGDRDGRRLAVQGPRRRGPRPARSPRARVGRRVVRRHHAC